MSHIYHATLDSHSEEKRFTYGECGHYEKFKNDNTPIFYQDSLIATSDTPQLACSKTIAGGIFAVLKNLINATGDAGTTQQNTAVTVYQISHKYDLDCSQTKAKDFHLLDEVRIEEKDKFPFTAPRLGTFQIPPQTLTDIELTYLPKYNSSPKILLDWGKAVKNGIAEIVDGNEYPHPIEENYTTTRPKLHDYF